MIPFDCLLFPPSRASCQLPAIPSSAFHANQRRALFGTAFTVRSTNVWTNLPRYLPRYFAYLNIPGYTCVLTVEVPSVLITE